MSAPPMILLALALSFVAFAGSPTPAHAQSAFQPTRGPRIILGRRHPGRITGLSDSGIVVDLKDGGTQTVQFNEIWRIRRAFAYDEPPGTTVIDFADNRLFVATPIATVVDDAAKKFRLSSSLRQTAKRFTWPQKKSRTFPIRYRACIIRSANP